MKLTQKQKKFADYYITTGNATESAIKAGYSKKTARQIATENLAKPYIQQYVAKKNKALEDERIADMVEVKRKVTSILREELEDVEVKDILKAAEFIAKTNGAFLDKVEVTEKHIIVDIEEDDEE